MVVVASEYTCMDEDADNFANSKLVRLLPKAELASGAAHKWAETADWAAV